MQNIVKFYLEQFKKDRHRRRRAVCIFLMLGVIVTVGVTWSLKRTGFTITDEALCGQEENVHTCSDREADVETASYWEATLPKNLTGNWADNLIAVAKSQLNYSESTRNFELSDDGSTCRGYTRYGEWYGTPYGDWNAMFVSFCVHYAGVPEEMLPYAADCYSWMAELQKQKLYIKPEDYTPVLGDLVFFDETGNGRADRVGILDKVSYNEAGEPTNINTIQGDVDNRVQYKSYSLSDGSILGYIKLPDNPKQKSVVDDATKSENANDATKSEKTNDATKSENANDATKSDSKDDEKTQIYTYTDKQIAITVKVPTQAGISEAAKLVVKPVTKNTKGFQETTEKVEKKVDGQVLRHLLYQIGFMVDGKEVEPDGGDIEVTINFTGQALQAKNTKDISVKVVHMKNEGEMEDVQANTVLGKDGSVKSLDFTTDSFSEYDIMLMASSTLQAGTYGNYQFSYNNQKNAFNSTDYQKYVVANSPLGTAGSFHLVSFGTATLNTHCNGNILANNLIANSNFGTNNLTNELSYIVNYQKVTGGSASSTAHTLVLGSANNVDNNADNGLSLRVNATKIDKPYNIVQDADSNTTPFIDLDSVRSEISQISTYMGSVSDTGVNASFSDQNNMSIALTSLDGAGYYNMTASFLNNINSGCTIKMDGFQSGHNGSIIVNVDCKGYGNAIIQMPKAIVYIDGQAQSVNETTTFNNGKVIWNFINANGLTINTNLMTGAVIALGATVKIEQNLNGTVVAQDITVDAESHRTDFTGTTVPAGQTYELPETGGIGTKLFTIIGMSFTIMSLFYLNRLRRKQERRIER